MSLRSTFALSVSITVVLVSVQQIRADSHIWVGGNPSGPWWNAPDNWAPAEQPADGDEVSILGGGSSDLSVNYYNTLYPDAVLKALDIDRTGTGVVTFDIGIGGTCDHSLVTHSERIGISGHAAVEQSAGTHQIDQFEIGSNAMSAGTYSLSGGTLLGYQEFIGEYGAGTFLQTGGTHVLTDSLASIDLGRQISGKGYYRLSGGEIHTTHVSLGMWGVGTFDHVSGLNDVQWQVSIGVWGTGVYTMSGGATLNTAGNIEVGAGTFTQDGGVTAAGSLWIGQSSPGTNSFYNLNDGTLEVAAGARTGTVRVGPYGTTGAFVQNGGLFSITSQSGQSSLLVGDGITARGRYLLNAGTLWANSDEQVGFSGAGTFTQAGGSNTAQQLILAANPSSSGLYTKTDGTLSLAGVVNHGTFLHSGGTLIISGGFTNTGTALVGGTQQWGSASEFSNSGIATFTSDAGAAAANLVVNATAGTTTFSSSQHLRGLNVSGSASVVFASTGGSSTLLRTTALNVTGGSLDLGQTSAIIDYEPGSSPVDAIRAIRSSIAAGRIRSSAADSMIHALGYGDNAILGKSDFAGETVEPNAILVTLTYRGDANLDSKVDTADLGALATNWQTVGTWTSGDFNYDGFIDVTDLGALATNWQAGVNDPLSMTSLESAMRSVGLSGAAVPEPVLLTILSAILILRSRAHNKRSP